MATSRARVRLAGRFSPGVRVELVEVASEAVLRTSPTDRVVESKFVDEGGSVEFTTNITAGGRYFVRGIQGGFPLEVRVTGRVASEDSVNALPPVQTEPRKFSDGSPVDVAPADVVRESEEAERVRKAGPAGSDSAREEEAEVRRERQRAAAEEREEAEADLSDEEKVGARVARSQSKRAPRASNDNVKGA